jgi:hypothetical protein
MRRASAPPRRETVLLRNVCPVAPTRFLLATLGEGAANFIVDEGSGVE